MAEQEGRQRPQHQDEYRPDAMDGGLFQTFHGQAVEATEILGSAKYTLNRATLGVRCYGTPSLYLSQLRRIDSNRDSNLGGYQQHPTDDSRRDFGILNTTRPPVDGPGWLDANS